VFAKQVLYCVSHTSIPLFFETGSQTGLEIVILLPQPPKIKIYSGGGPGVTDSTTLPGFAGVFFNEHFLR
jgi:hypothetical protein